MSNYKFENPDELTNEQLWLIATSAMLTQYNRQRHDTLFPHGGNRSAAWLKDIKECLRRDWEIESLADLSDTLAYLHEEKTFIQAQESWEMFSALELEKASQMEERLGDIKNVMHMVQSYQFSLHHFSDFGWHYGRCSWLIRMSAFVGYISPQEAWALLEENAVRIKQMFSSWEEFGISYMVGAQYWRRQQYTENSIREFMDNFLYLLTNRNSPWLHVKWEA